MYFMLIMTFFYNQLDNTIKPSVLGLTCGIIAIGVKEKILPIMKCYIQLCSNINYIVCLKESSVFQQSKIEIMHLA